MCRACIDDESAALVCAERLPDYLRRRDLFGDLTEEQLDEVVDRSRTVRLTAGRWLYRQGDRADRFFVVREGQIALFRQSSEGRESIITIVGPDEVFGDELIFLPEATNDLNARSVGDSTLLSIDRAGFRSFLEESPSLGLRLLGTLHRRQRMLLDHIERLTLQDATQRLMATGTEATRTDKPAERPKHVPTDGRNEGREERRNVWHWPAGARRHPDDRRRSLRRAPPPRTRFGRRQGDQELQGRHLWPARDRRHAREGPGLRRQV